jgi:hypothetical protein
MADKPTSDPKNFLFERQFSTKRTLVFDLTIECGDKGEVNNTKKQEERLAVFQFFGKKLKLSTPTFQVQEGQEGHKRGKILSEEEAPTVIYSTYGPRLHRFQNAFQVTFEEVGSIIKISPEGFKTVKQSKDQELFT